MPVHRVRHHPIVVDVGAPASEINFLSFFTPAPELRSVLDGVFAYVDAGVTMGDNHTLTALTPQLPAAELEAYFPSWQTLPWVDVATESPASDWEDFTNFEGNTPGTAATLTEGLVLTQGTLIGTFPTLNAKPADLLIDAVRLVLYYEAANFLLPGTSLQVAYRVGGALGTATTIHTFVGNALTSESEDYETGRTFDITASGPDGIGGAWTWADLSELRVELAGTILVDVGLSAVTAWRCQLQVDAHTEV